MLKHLSQLFHSMLTKVRSTCDSRFPSKQAEPCLETPLTCLDHGQNDSKQEEQTQKANMTCPTLKSGSFKVSCLSTSSQQLALGRGNQRTGPRSLAGAGPVYEVRSRTLDASVQAAERSLRRSECRKESELKNVPGMHPRKWR